MGDEPRGAWRHSHEEDSGGDVQVYRPADWAFPPARGRRGLEFRPDGKMLVLGPGPDDRPETREGSRDELEIVSLEPDRLAVRWA